MSKLLTLQLAAYSDSEERDVHSHDASHDLDGSERIKVLDPRAAQKAHSGSGPLSHSALVDNSNIAPWTAVPVRKLSITLPDAGLLLAASTNLSFAREEYRIVRTKIAHLLPQPFRLAITSPSVGDGKTLTAINLAASLALTGARTLLVDADLRRANVHLRMNAPGEPGLSEVLRGTSTLQEAIFQTEQLPALHVLPAGGPADNISELLHAKKWHTLGDSLRSSFAHTLIDCPPADLFADYDLIAAVCDGVLLVVRPDHTERAMLRSALTKLSPRMVGVVVNATRDSIFNGSSARRYQKYYDRYYDKKSSNE
jgi:protein-tyrosine kinase